MILQQGKMTQRKLRKMKEKKNTKVKSEALQPRKLR